MKIPNRWTAAILTALTIFTDAEGRDANISGNPESPVSELEVRVVGLDGNIVQSQTLTRPKPFSTDIK